MKKSLKFLVILTAVLVFALTTAGSALADNHESDCMIPDSGPWPPCATGGEETEQWMNRNAPMADCMIPESGPWPACATGGAAPMADSMGDMDDMGDSTMDADDMGDSADMDSATDSADTGNPTTDTVEVDNTEVDAETAFEIAFAVTFARLYDTSSTAARADARVPLIFDAADDAGIVDTVVLALSPLETEFAPFDFLVASAIVRGATDTMGGSMDRISDGSGESCEEYAGGYLLAAISPRFTDVPGEWQGLVGQYEASIVTLLESNKDLMVQSCITAGPASEFNFGRARAGTDASRDQIQPVLEATVEMLTSE